MYYWPIWSYHPHYNLFMSLHTLLNWKIGAEIIRTEVNFKEGIDVKPYFMYL